MSLRSDQYNRENIRRYTIKSTSIDSTRNNSFEGKTIFGKSSSSNRNQSSINDPYVKQLLEKNIDFSKLYQNDEEEIELLNSNHIKLIPKDFPYKNNNHRNNLKSFQYPLKSSLQCNFFYILFSSHLFYFIL